jgi:hypothetical protein
LEPKSWKSCLSLHGPAFTLANGEEQSIQIEQHDPGLARIVAPGQEVEDLASGFGNDQCPAEGPLWWHEGRHLLYSDIGNDQRM